MADPTTAELDSAGEPLTEQALTAVRISAKRGSPFGEPAWVQANANRLGLEAKHRLRGRRQVRFSPPQDNNEQGEDV